jgi:outer membrane biosynthesis protein TonB
VVIDAVIDDQGNVVEMQAVSGNRLLIPAAMHALRHWRYEPTLVNGQAVPIRLLVTMTFQLKSASLLGSAD